MARQYQFFELALGTRFDFTGEEFTKIAMDMARAQDGTANIFPAEAEVTPIGEVLLLSPKEAERWYRIGLIGPNSDFRTQPPLNMPRPT